MPPIVLFLKAFVPGHESHTRDGAAIYVKPYATRAPAADVPPVISFRSGASAPNHFRGYVLSNVPAGVCLAEVGPRSATWDMMVSYANRGGKVFVDSGAFTAFTRGKPVDWERVMGLYRRLVEEAPAACFSMVMPDVVGDQMASLNLLTRYRDTVRDLIEHGQDCLVPVQKGVLTPYQAWRTAADILGTDAFAVSVPSNRVAFSLDDLRNLFAGPEKPGRVHLLGIAGDRKRLAELAKVIHTANPRCIVTTDANRIRAQVGEQRPLTKKQVEWARHLDDSFRRVAEMSGNPALVAAWKSQGKDVVQGPALSFAMMELEAKPRDQTDLFGTDRGEARRA